MIYTVTFSPTLDYVVSVENFQPGIINRTTSEHVYPGGKGVNVSIALKSFGYENTALGFIAGFTGAEIKRQLHMLGVQNNFINVEQGMSRVNMKIVSDTETAINGQGPQITYEDIGTLYARLRCLVDGDYLVLAGHIPDILPLDMYEQVLDDNVTGSIKGRSCINLSLSRTRTIDFDDIYERFDDFEDGKETDIMVLADKITKAIQVLEQAKEDLAGNGCVGEEDTLDLSIPEEERNEAEKLASDIDKEIEKLKEMLEKLKQSAGGGGSDDTDNNHGSGSGDSESQPSGGDAREDEVRDFLEEQQTRTKEEQEQSQSDYDERNYWSGEDAGFGDDSANPKPW